MRELFRLMDWSLRIKLAVVLLIIFLLSLGLAEMTLKRGLFVSMIVLVSFFAGMLLAAAITVREGHADELAWLRKMFNSLAERVEIPAAAPSRANDELEIRIQARTAELLQKNKHLDSEVVERSLVVAALKDNEQSLVTTFNSIGDAVISADMQARVVRMNPVAERLTGWAIHEAKGQPLDSVFCILNEDTGKRIESPAERVLREGVIVGLAKHTALISRNGSQCPIGDIGAPILDDQGVQHGVVLVFRDITKEREAQHVLQQSQAHKAAILETALDCIISMDSAGRIIEFNPAAERTFGYSHADAIGKPLAELLIPKLQRAAHADGLKHYLATGEGSIIGKRVKLTAMRADGTEFPIEATIVRIASASFPMFTGFIRDLTELQSAEWALRHSEDRNHLLQIEAAAAILHQKAEEKFRALLEAAPDAIVIVNKAGQIQLVNAQAEQLFGYPKPELLDQPVEMLIPVRLREQHSEYRASFCGTPRHHELGAGLDLSGLRKDGSEFPIEIRLSPIATEDGLLIASAIRDITERKRTEGDLQSANRELEAFSYSVAHDLRAPLRGMNGFAQVLLETYKDKLDAEGKDWLAEIILNARKMGSLIDALLSLSQLTRAQLKPDIVDLGAIVHSALAHLVASEPRRVVEFSIQKDLQAVIDPHLARIAIENLVGNAWKFTSKQPCTRIEFGSMEKNGVSTFFIKDNGAGFDMAFADKLFAPFHRLHTVAEFPGTGIGLATVQRILYRHGGRIWAEGVVNGGATFYFTLPNRLKDGSP